jgi:hypothetical protein
MAFRLKTKDIAVLASLAEYRLITVPQSLGACGFSGLQVARRRLAALEEQHLVQSSSRGYGRHRGRPEKVFGLTPAGFDVLKEQGRLPGTAEFDQVSGAAIACPDHQLLLNWFRVHLTHLPTALPRLSVAPVATSNSPFVARVAEEAAEQPEDISGALAQQKKRGLVPDAVFAITDAQEKKSLLFFLEVDMGTETVASPSREPGDLRAKVTKYQQYFRENAYRAYERPWSATFNGFRLLILTNTPERLHSLCALVREMQPSGFVWLTCELSLTADGLAAPIWARAGRTDKPLESIVGPGMSRCTPLPPPKP